MHRSQIPIPKPCGADWSEMTPAEARARLCEACDTLVYDVSAMSADEVRRTLARGPRCVRYLYDRHGEVILGAPPRGSQIVPASALLSRAARSRWLAAAALATVPILFEACGSEQGDFVEAGADAAADGDAANGDRHRADVVVGDGGTSDASLDGDG